MRTVPDAFGLSRRTLLAGLPLGLSWLPRYAAAADSCPGVDARTGARTALALPARTPTLPAAREVPAAWRQTALEILALFESGRRDVEAAYANVSSTDVMSLGFLQWNHNAGSLYRALLKDQGAEAIQSAPPSVREGVTQLIAVSQGRASRAEGQAVLTHWKSLASWKTVERRDLQAWLATEPLITRQKDLIDGLLTRALRMADAWVRDSALPGGPKVAQRAFYSFADIAVFSGDLAGLWVEHVADFRRQFPDGLSMMDHISGWVAACDAFRFSGIAESGKGDHKPKYSRPYRLKETPIAVAEWRRMLAAGDPRIDEDALNLLALGYLRARLSSGDDYPNGFHGVFQLDVLNRRGMMATGVGVRNGNTTLEELYRL